MEPRRETALVTGGTDGIGKAIARELAKHGSEVLIVGRDRGKGERAADELRASAGHDRVRFLEADLSLVRGARRLAADVIVSVPKLHRLILCAGIVRTQRVLTEEEVESNFSTNYLSRFALTGRLLPLLQAAGTPDAVARILVIGGAAMNGTIHYDDVNLTRHFGIRTVVSQFCQANDLFVIEQARRLAERNKPPRVTITTLKVGVVRTNIRRTFPWWMRMLVGLVFDPLFGHTPEQIAASAMRLLATPEFEGASGRLFTQIKRFKVAEPGARMQDPREGQRLWDFSEHLVASARASGL